MQKKIIVAVEHLRNADPVIKSLIDKIGSCTLFEKNSLLHKPHFHVLVWAILNQQLSVKAARSIENKLLSLLETCKSSQGLFEPGQFEIRGIISLSDKNLASCGLSRQKIRYLRVLCTAVQSKKITLKALDKMDNESVANMLRPLPGIGPWTIDMFLMFSLARLDVLPLGDLALRKAFELHYPLPATALLEDYQAIATAWQPYRTVASWYLWASVD
jgi:DNA-3-methyladenine glycosylase II